MDKDGCWVTNEEGGRDYIMFWSEASRKFFMGDSTAPYTNVVSMAEGATLGLLCGVPEPAAGLKTVESICTQWVDEGFGRVDWITNLGSKEAAIKSCMDNFGDDVEQAEHFYNKFHSGGQPNDGQPDESRPS